MKYELVCGLETHVELSTESKIFCSCRNDFGGEPNTHCCPICIGLPGTLPKLNSEVVNLAIKAGLALNCKINMISKMDRKNYVYPDLPKAYQISQYDLPLCKDGFYRLRSGKKIRIARIHIEEDAGKLVHKGADTFIDYNRGGVPLIEIVTEPDISDSDEAREYLEGLQAIMRYTGISDCKMQEGSMRCDVNISVKPTDSDVLGIRTEIKNMNSLSFMVKAIEFEKMRQIELIEDGKKVEQETLRYNEATGCTESMRGKENAHDYRYFREPDLVTISVSEEKIKEIKNSLPSLPDERFSNYTKNLKMSESDAKLIIKYKKVSDFFEESIKELQNPKIVLNFIIGIIFSKLENESSKENFDIKLNSEELNKISKLVEDGKLQMNLAKSTINKILETGKKLEEIINPNELRSIDENELKEVCLKVINENIAAVDDYKNGKEKALKALIGQVMKVTKGKADPKKADSTLKGLINTDRANHTK